MGASVQRWSRKPSNRVVSMLYSCITSIDLRGKFITLLWVDIIKSGNVWSFSMSHAHFLYQTILVQIFDKAAHLTQHNSSLKFRAQCIGTFLKWFIFSRFWTLRSVLQNYLHRIPFQPSRITSRHFKLYVNIQQRGALFHLMKPNTERDIIRPFSLICTSLFSLPPGLADIHVNKAWAATWVVKVMFQIYVTAGHVGNIYLSYISRS